MPESRKPLAWKREFSSQERATLSLGLVPEAREHEWFIFEEGGVVYFHRSETGLCCYELELGGGCWYNPEVEMGEPARLLESLVDRLLAPPRRPLDPGKSGIELSRQKLETTGCEFLAYGGKANGDMKGGPSAPILLAAGPEVQEAFRKGLAQSSRALGEVLLTEPFNLRSRGVLGIFHVIAFTQDLSGGWVGRPEPMGAAVTRVMAMCRELKAHSVALAALAASKPNVAPDGSARVMIRAARESLRQHPEWPLRVVFALPDPQVYQAFLRRLQGAG